MVCPMISGPSKFNAELVRMAPKAISRFFRSCLISSSNLPSDDHVDDLGAPACRSFKLYFIIAGALLRIKYLYVFGTAVHQFLMFAGGYNFALHQQNDLV